MCFSQSFKVSLPRSFWLLAGSRTQGAALAMVSVILSVSPHHMTPCAVLSWVWKSVVGWCFLGQSWRNPAQSCSALLLPFSPISCFVQCGTSLGLGTTEKLYVRAKQMQLQVQGQPMLWPSA